MVLCSCSSDNIQTDYVYYRLNADISTLDPAYITDVNNGSIATKIYRGLVKLDDSLNVIPDIAERWEILNDRKLYRFYLRKDVTFTNGRRVTAEDFKYSYERIMKKETLSPNQWLFERVKSFVVINDHIFEIHLKDPFTPFLSMLTVPAGFVVPGEEVKKLGKDFSFKPTGAGYYYLEKWESGLEIRLKLRDEISRQSNIKGIIYRIIPEDITAITEFEMARLDLLGIPGNAFSRFKKHPYWHKRLEVVKSLNTYYLGLNTERYPFNLKEIRQAIAFAIDRERILNTFFESRGRIAEGVVPDFLRDWKLDQTIRYSPEEGKKILQRAGIKELKVQMLITADQDVVDLAEIIQGYLSQVGIKVKIKQMEWSAFKDAINKGQADMFWLSWWADYPDAENFLYPLFHSSNKGYGGNRTRFNNKQIDMLIEESRIAKNKDESRKLYREIENIILTELPLIPFWHRNDYLIVQSRIEGYRGFPVYTMDKGLEIKKLTQANKDKP